MPGVPHETATQDRIQQRTDLATMERWVENTVTAPTLDDVFRA